LRLLLDTHILLWRMHGTPVLGGDARDRLASAEEVLVSAISFLEIGIKASIGKLHLPENLREHVLESGARILTVSPEHGLGVAELPLHHRDPFDRLLIAQARQEGLTILTADPDFTAYDVSVVLAVT
jgi:PIN domain nuclease of toxin-antitoxin system